MATLDLDTLLAARSDVHEVELPGLGTVKVRPLTRSEAVKLRGVERDALELERHLVALAMVEPKMTEEQVQQWQDVSPAGELEPVAQAIVHVSGMTKESGKQAYADFRE